MGENQLGRIDAKFFRKNCSRSQLLQTNVAKGKGMMAVACPELPDLDEEFLEADIDASGSDV